MCAKEVYDKVLDEIISMVSFNLELYSDLQEEHEINEFLLTHKEKIEYLAKEFASDIDPEEHEEWHNEDWRECEMIDYISNFLDDEFPEYTELLHISETAELNRQVREVSHISETDYSDSE